MADPLWFLRHLQRTPACDVDDTYQDAEGLYYPVHLLVIDAMGPRTSDVYDFTHEYPGRTQAYKGASGRKANPQTWTTIDRYPGACTFWPR